eukprot:TRINITY_DN16729_c0_g1_i1.p2 TRINITY_DN16729_c0_g1~~TRINITY_DN16729_c0_g1_i1.p2  ORF type:complete len:304 (-),score=43.50 TRINITY_DN16729_c0_g1_i1:136-1047(-)
MINQKVLRQEKNQKILLNPKKRITIKQENLIECHYISYTMRSSVVEQPTKQLNVLAQATIGQTKQTKRNLLNLLIDKPIQQSWDRQQSARSFTNIITPRINTDRSLKQSQQQSLQDLNINEDIDIEEKNNWTQSMAKYTQQIMANKIALDRSRVQTPKSIKSKKVLSIDKQLSTLSHKLSIELELENNCGHPPILIVDDDEFNILGCQFILKRLSLSSLSANNGQRAISVVEDQCEKRKECSCKGFKLILMDINMPVMDGYTATKLLQEDMKNNKLPYMPIVACTAFASSLEKEAMLLSLIHI